MDENNINNIFLNDILFNCSHYIRGCQYLSPCCNKIFNCRLCHDSEFENDLKNQHNMINSDTKKIICKQCNLLQDFSQYCQSCKLCFGKYYCEKCKFVDDKDSQQYFHCDKCRMCRRGNKDDFEHCDNCGLCFDKMHKKFCKNKGVNNECPICFENLPYSTSHILPLSCGHIIHFKCLQDHVKSNNMTCPLCRKTIIKNKINDAFLKICTERLEMPEEYKDKKVNILCQDCEKKSIVNLHFIAMFCPYCNSHNVTQI
jgi:RING finger/CHY zinc finger protein 1